MESVYQHYTSFLLTDIETGETMSLTEDFDAMIINEDDKTYTRECLPDFNDITDKVNFIDGEVFVKSTYEPRTIPMTIFFDGKHSDGDMKRFKKWIGQRFLMKFRWENDWEDEEKYLLVKLKNGLETETFYSNNEFNSKMKLTFIAYDPFWRYWNEKIITFHDLVSGDSKKVKHRGDVNSYPFIYITPKTANLTLKWNDLEIKLKDLVVGREYTIDCEKCKFYYVQNGKNIGCLKQYESDKYFTYPKFDIKRNNTITLISGEISLLKVNPNTLII